MSDQYIRIRLNEDLVPMEAFFASIRKDLYLRTLAAFAQGHGAGFDDVGSTFPSDDPAIPEGKVAFNLLDYEIVVTIDQFRDVLRRYNSEFVARNPEARSEATSLMKAIEDRFGLPR